VRQSHESSLVLNEYAGSSQDSTAEAWSRLGMVWIRDS